ncbi:hybrid sensor histidine kinase/response regulator [Thermosynechococcus sp. JY1334]|uniref:hybrid sensor histidine kinase/response regulator n=1 Tax=unclassified Thermosynechococcus TaxID=2622553 RepID=UPI002672AC67|nr:MULTISPECIES: hybrid sensor histidine kinase/response regulator [unclassified Thermosynechococcus]MDR7899196.1 hybrid sensor histidine kinase/response regulator [Thermosynechococcus sp. JY1332]MDR7906603.1 hybrid sensor histidine kinase/response regulator [Thermosynechococcus sp. JY1334]WKT86318.1 hybrid sensor histidine kinase/response regulator [Thermosynechococcus sp. JY1339]WNC55263.1 hybrid sensor histidine kinase/response regulator [Thermosynechococcus sp. JY1331]
MPEPGVEETIRLQFLEEAQDYLQTIEAGILELSHQPGMIDAVLRAAHSIKGGAAMMGFMSLSELAHRLEDFFKVLKSRPCDDVEVQHLLLKAVDQLQAVITLHRQGVNPNEGWWRTQVEPLLNELHGRLGDPTAEDDLALLSGDDGQQMRVVLFETEVEACLQRLETVLDTPGQPCLREELAIAAQELEGLGQMLELPQFAEFCASVSAYLEQPNCDVSAAAAHIVQQWRRCQALVITGQLDALPTRLEIPETDDEEEDEDQTIIDLPLANLNQELGVEDFASAEVETFSLGDLLSPPPTPTAAPSPAPEAETTPVTPQPQEPKEMTVRVPGHQLDQLSDLIGELLIECNGLDLQRERLHDLLVGLKQKVRALERANFRLRTEYDRVSAPHHFNPQNQHGFDVLEFDRYTDVHLLSQEVMETIVQVQEITSDLELSLEDTERTGRDLNRTAKQLQARFTQVRMRPFADLANRYPRLIRELSREHGKNVNLEIEGSHVLIDRTVLSVLADPLLHLVRNAFDHGIEPAEERQALGKPTAGTITLKAAYRGNQTVITVADDGRGLNPEKIRQTARRLGLARDWLETASDRDLWQLIFEPGFSTASQVTSLSGRGVGMDVVRTNLRQIRGDIQIHSTPGQGTRFIITIPYTLSVVRVLLVEAAGMLLAVPTEEIEEMVLGDRYPPIETLGSTLIDWEGYLIPVIDLTQIFHFQRPYRPVEMEGAPTINEPTLMIVSQGDSALALRVDRYWSEQEVTIRQVEGELALPKGFSGCTILGNGRIVPLLDPLALFNWAEQESSHAPVASPVAPSQDTVLVVDDSVNVRRFLASTLEKAGYRVEQAKDGQEAIDKLQGGLHVNAVICDIEMPRLDGFGVLTQIRRIPQCQNTPVMMLTSRTGQKHRQLAERLGAAAYFSKPFRESDLLATLDQLIRHA